MVEIRNVSFHTKFAVAIQLIDSYTGQPPIEKQIKVELENVIQKPVFKRDGTYIFTDLAPGTYNACVQAENYLSKSFALEIQDVKEREKKHLVVCVPLIPNPSYPVLQGTTALRAAFRDHSGIPISGVAVNAIPATKECGVARLALDAQQGSRSLSMTQISGQIAVGDKLLVMSAAQEHHEICQISGVTEYMKCFDLESSLVYEHKRGAYLVPVSQAISDHRGELLLFFRNSKARSYQVRLEISYLKQQLVKEVRITGGTIHQLGMIEIPK